MRIAINGGALNQAWSGSSCKSNGSNYSNFPSAPCTGLGLVNWTLNASSPASVRNTLLRHGVGAWRHACVPIGGLSAGDMVTLRFAALDQGDTGYDSALLLDHLGHAEPAERVREAVSADIAERGDAKRSTSEIGDAIAARIGAPVGTH